MQCIFCENKANSKEHIWGKWLRNVYPVTDGSPKDGHIEDRNDQSGKIVPSRGQFKGGEHSFFKTSKVVCADCNNNWMSQIEEAVKKQFPRIFLSAEPRIEELDFVSLKKWCFLKFCVIEAATEQAVPKEAFELEMENQIIEKAELSRRNRNLDFCTHQEIPDDFYVFIGRSVDVRQDGGSSCINSNPVTIFSKEEFEYEERKTFLGFVGHMHFLVTNHPALIGFIFSKFFPKGDRVGPLTNPKFKVTEIPLAAMNSDTLEDEVCTFLEKRENRKLRRNFAEFEGRVHIVPPRKRNAKI